MAHSQNSEKKHDLKFCNYKREKKKNVRVNTISFCGCSEIMDDGCKENITNRRMKKAKEGTKNLIETVAKFLSLHASLSKASLYLSLPHSFFLFSLYYFLNNISILFSLPFHYSPLTPFLLLYLL